MWQTQSRLKEEIAKRYTLTYNVNKLWQEVKESLWWVTLIFLGFSASMLFGGHIINACLNK